jgi:hypothetical protein
MTATAKRDRPEDILARAECTPAMTIAGVSVLCDWSHRLSDWADGSPSPPHLPGRADMVTAIWAAMEIARRDPSESPLVEQLMATVNRG